MKVLLVDPDLSAISTKEFLKQDGFNVYETNSGEEAIFLAKTYDYNAIVLELKLYDMNGFDIIKTMRAAKIKTAIIVSSWLNDVVYKVKALNLGADDCLIKPFDNIELAARIKAVVRRCCGYAQSIIKVGDLTINLDAKIVDIAGRMVRVSSHEYSIMELFALRKGTVVTKEMMMDYLYSGMDEPDIKIIDVYICKLRAKLERYGVKRHINTVWGRGFMLQAPLIDDKHDPVGINSDNVLTHSL